MQEIITKLGETGAVLVVIVPLLVQLLKKLPILVKLQSDGYPIYEIAAIAIGIAGAFGTGVPNPIITGIVIGLASGKGYDLVTKNSSKK